MARQQGPPIVGMAAARLSYDVYHRNSAADGSYNHRPVYVQPIKGLSAPESQALLR